MARRLCLLTAALLAAAVLGCAAAGRSASHWERVQGAMRSGRNDMALKWLQRGLIGKHDEKEDEGCGIMAIKYEVPPSMHEEFVDEWMKLEDKTRDEEGCRLFDLKKTMGDNIYFWTQYGEWDDMESYMDHFKADYTTDFLDYLASKDITWEMFPLENVTDNSAQQKAG
ncbi:hypothetical protein GPECTOR_5g151 [Gonium pectorale]|uniref:ABM domain-containing protein n=1 Tax=Gonium pectorale TaxID=33097 RepID=A0A150GWG1_GONPE|nr:hypothetical protein GPECTOR_5g151 [Gonium pectorale]|eukprot:KXZ54042.1 hypothetical protein GPECTOR_5g151 [Gonium pectorale]